MTVLPAVQVASPPAVTAPPSPMEWQAMREQAQVIVASGLAPRGVDTAEKVLAIALKGRELALPPMQALSHIHIIEGKPALSAELMVALVQRAGHRLRVVDTTAERCVVEGVRADDPDHPTRTTWTTEDAKRAKVDSKNTWRQYPAAMLRARAISALCRFAFADVLMGCSYTPEELGAEVDDEGNVIDVDPVAAYRDPDHQAALDEVDRLLALLDEHGVKGDADKARRRAAESPEAARKVLAHLRNLVPGDAQAVSGPQPSGSDKPAGPAAPATPHAPVPPMTS